MTDSTNSASKRILAVALEGDTAVLSRVMKDLSGTAPSTPSADVSIAGTTHSLQLTTAYYSATVPVWLDLVADPTEWSSMFLSPEAAEVLDVLGGFVVVFSAGSASGPAAERTRDLIAKAGQVVKQGLGGWEWDGVGLAVGVGETDRDEWDELCTDAGLEFVMVTGKEGGARNEFGEKTGIARVEEALQANAWESMGQELPDFSDDDDNDNDNDDADDEELDPDNMGFGFDKADFEGLRQSIWQTSQDQSDDDAPKGKRGKEETSAPDHMSKNGEPLEPDDDDITKMDSMMKKLLAVREAGEGLPEEQRKRMAAQAVKEVMKEL